jgi:hypothetical protein
METIKVGKNTKDALGQITEQEKRSEDAIVRDALDAYNRQRFLESLREMQRIGAPIAKRLGLETDDDIERYLG